MGQKEIVWKKVTPQYDRTALFASIKEVTDHFAGNSPPSIFVSSRLKYPQVNVGILSPPEHIDNAWIYDAPPYWGKENYRIDDIIALRTRLINSRFKSTVHQAKNASHFLELAQEIGMAYKPVDVEIELQKKIKIGFETDNVHLPMGPQAPLKKVTINENPRVHMKVDKVVSDTDLKASEALTYLTHAGFDEHTLSKLLSLGVLGLKKNRKLVPTRWSITSVDDTMGKQLLEDIREFPMINDYQLFTGNYLGNYYLVLLFPEVFSYELFELYLPGSAWNTASGVHAATDYEDYYGRKTYAGNTVGGYYASRLPLLRYLHQQKRQASVLVIRFETPEYYASLGVWVVRQAMKKTMMSQPTLFSSKEDLLKTARTLGVAGLKFDIEDILGRSKLLHQIKEQVKLTHFF